MTSPGATIASEPVARIRMRALTIKISGPISAARLRRLGAGRSSPALQTIRTETGSRRILRMRISIFGLGYVGSVTAACLAKAGHEVIGVDVNPDKVAMINAGKSPVIEPGLADLIQQVT